MSKLLSYRALYPTLKKDVGFTAISVKMGELQHNCDHQKSQSLPIELSSLYNYTDGITYHYVHHGDLELGRYWRNPWFDGWIFVSFGVGDGIQQEADTDYQAIACITKSWEQVLPCAV